MLRQRAHKSKKQSTAMEKVRVIKMQFEDVLKKFCGVESVRNYTGPDPRMRALQRILGALQLLVSQQPAITPSRINEICQAMKMASLSDDHQQSIHTIRRVNVSAKPPVAIGMFDKDTSQWKPSLGSLQKGLGEILQSDVMNGLRKDLGLQPMEERKIIKSRHK